MKILSAIDQVLLVKFQSFTEWTQRIFGIRPFQIMQIIFVLLSIFSILENYHKIIYQNKDGNVFGLWRDIIMLPFGIMFVRIAEKLMERIRSRDDVSSVLIEHNFALFRQMVILMSIIDVIRTPIYYALSTTKESQEVISNRFFADVIIMLILYLMSSKPKPPKKNWFKEKIDQLKTLLSPQPKLALQNANT